MHRCSQFDHALGVPDGVVDGVIEDTGQKVLIEEAVNVIGFDCQLDPHAVKKRRMAGHLLGQEVRNEVLLNMCGQVVFAEPVDAQQLHQIVVHAFGFILQGVEAGRTADGVCLLLAKLIRMFPDLNLMQGYGMTEGSAVLTVLTADDHRKGGSILKSAGRPVPGARL